ncbi:MAG: substrate-binding domain-containing protein [Oscillospiraceae bacterium]|jgi:phosphate transport system substrate-binding protein|nr:substrate-binding domain-containing protein [Oscillospiraceae bacterium]
MKKLLAIITSALLALTLASCATSTTTTSSSATSSEDATPTLGAINVVSREEGSGTRSAFIELTGVEQKNADGKKVDFTTEDAEITDNTSLMLTKVSTNINAIGYVSLGSLDSSVKALNFDGAAATADNVKNGSYKLARPFNILTNDKKKLSAPAQDFVDFILSTEGQKIVSDNHYIALEGTSAYAASGAKGDVTVAGSSSVSPLMQKLIEAYNALTPDVKVKLDTSDSGTGIKSTQDSICDIGMASRDLKSEETGITAVKIATDGIAVIVNLQNPLASITKDQVKDIYVGDITEWADVK